MKIVIAALFLLSAECVLAGQDWEYWSNYSLKIPYNQVVGFSFEPQFRFRNSFKEFYYSKTYLGLFCRASRFVDVRGYYAYKTKKGLTGWRETDLLYLDAILMLSIQKLDISNRFRLEYDINEREWVYRNRTSMGKTFHGGKTFFVKEEAFYSVSSNRFEENRLSGGFSISITKRMRIITEYMLNSKRVNSVWNSANVLVTGINLIL